MSKRDLGGFGDVRLRRIDAKLLRAQVINRTQGCVSRQPARTADAFQSRRWLDSAETA